MGHTQPGSLVPGVRHTVRALVGALVLAGAGGSVEVSASDGVEALAAAGVEVLAGAGFSRPGDGRKNVFH